MEFTYQKPIVLGVNTTLPAQPVTVQRRLERTGQNTGNILFAEAVAGLFEKPIVTDYGLPNPSVVERGDCIVIAAANWLNEHADFGRIADKLEATNLPIIALGLGAQSSIEKRIPKLKPGTERLVALLAERSPKIAARGAFSCEVLAHYGATNVEATGCPSLLMQGKQAPAFIDRQAGEALQPHDVALHSTRHHFHEAPPFYTYFYRQGIEQGFDLLLQSELADFYQSLGEEAPEEQQARITPLLAAVYQKPATEIDAYLRSHGHVYFELESWLDYCRSKRFFLGTRIHGTIAAVLAGTPAMLVAHDSRTVEMSQAMSIPYITRDQIDIESPLQVAAYFEQAMAHDFEPGYSRYLSGFKSFFEDCGLRTKLFSA